MDFTNERLRNALGSRPFQYYAQISSTNDAALSWLRDGGQQGSLVIADYQTEGRGRLGRSWYAPPGTSLMFSMLLRPTTRYLPKITMIAALAVGDALEDIGVTTALKWSNDLLLNGRKVCGILSEGAWNGSVFIGVALGVGINLNVDFSGTPLELTAANVSEVIPSLDRVDLLARAAHRLDGWMERINTDAPRTAWRERLITIGQRVRVVQPGETLVGIAEDVDEFGALMIRRDDGRLGRVLAGDIVGLSIEP